MKRTKNKYDKYTVKRTEIEQSTRRNLGELYWSEDNIRSIEFFRKKFTGSNWVKGEILVSDEKFDLVYSRSKPYSRTIIRKASKMEDGVNIVMQKFARETDMTVEDVQRQIENII